MENELIKLYGERKELFQSRVQTIRSKTADLSWLRVGVAIIILLLLYFSFQWIALWWVTGAVTVCYFLLVSHHEKLNQEKRLYENLQLLNESEIKAQQGDHLFFEDGSEFIDAHHPYSVDLDIFGKGSIFQRFNRTCTETGKERLARILEQPLFSRKEILGRQEAISELSGKIDLRQTFWATGVATKEKKEDQKQLLAWLSTPSILHGKKSYRILLLVAPLVFLAALLGGIVTGKYALFIIVALAQWAIIGMHSKRVTVFQDYIGNKRFLLEKFAAHFKLLHEQKFAADALRQINAQSYEAYQQLQVLASRSRALDLRLNFFANALLNTTVLYELQCVYRLEQWRDKNRDHLAAWLNAVQEADALSSLATFKFNHPRFVFPEIADNPTLIADGLGHPLIPLDHSVTNSIQVDPQTKIWIVTGANMAGKSTFLRTLGVNTVLALTGSVVCATKMICPITGIYTGMRNTDSINDNQSYFFAELLRLQKIMQELRTGKRLIVLLDEILKGTNSIDKLAGSQELLHKLVSYQGFTVIATHDVALSEMEKDYPEKIKNYHFETFIKGDELSFDYKLKPGVSTGKNATFLMKKMGIIV